MLFDFADLAARARYKLLVSTITPRPIAWVVSQDSRGLLNAAPFSFFNAFSADPPVIGIGIGSHARVRAVLAAREEQSPAPGAGSTWSPPQMKDTRANIAETGEFVVNLVSEEVAQAMNVTAIEFEPGVNELAEAGLTTCPSVRVKPPRIAESPVSMECELLQIVDLGASGLVLGRVLAMHIREDAVIDAAKCYVDTPKLRLIGRMHGTGWYARTSDLFEMPRIPVQDWKR